MKKTKLKDLFNNPLVSFIKENNITMSRRSVKHLEDSMTEELIFQEKDKNKFFRLSSLLSTRFFFHNTSFYSDFKTKNVFNYNSNQFENISSINSELELPLFYLENTNEHNEELKSFKALNSSRITKTYLLNIANLQKTIPFKNTYEKQKMSNILFCNSYNTKRNKEEMQQVHYYNHLKLTKDNTTTIFGDFLKEIMFQEEFLGCLETYNETSQTEFVINDNLESSMVQVKDLYDIINNGVTQLNYNNKIVFSKEKNFSNVMNNSFKKFLINNFLNNKKHLLKNLKRIIENEECEKEIIIYKVEKFIESDRLPTQSFWMFEENFKEFIDLQIKRDSVYRYEFKPFVLIYGTEVVIRNEIVAKDTIKAFATYSPSFKIVQLNLGVEFLKISPHIQLPPYVKFINESNSNNYIKIYLDLKKGSHRKKLENITDKDTSKISFLEFDEEGKAKVEYFTQQGVFEVFRSNEKPNEVYDFGSKKILNAENKYYSTSVVFKDKILPNKKYYYMFRALNVVGTPSNPTSVYEVELIKDSNNSKINVKTVPMDKKFVFQDKKMKRLLQIKPSFEQRVFDDNDPAVQDLDSYKKNIEKISLGAAPDKLWGKKFKIRVKSRDTGKIIDLNIKFNVIKDNII